LLENVPPNQAAQPVQLMLPVENVFRAVAEYIQLRACNLLVGLYQKSPEIEGQKYNITENIVIHLTYLIN